MNMLPKLSLAVVGLSVAGVAAALELLQAGAAVRLLDDSGGGGWIQDFYEIGPTPISPATIPAFQFEEIARATLLQRGAIFQDLLGAPEKIIEHADGTGVTLVPFIEEPIIASGVIFAGDGGPPMPDPAFEFQRYMGRRMSWSVASYGVIGKRVVVVGVGAYALEQACLAARNGAQVTLLCAADRLHDPRNLSGRLAAAPGGLIRTGVAVRRVISDADGNARAIELTQDGQPDLIKFDWMFFADEPEVCWDSWRDLKEWLFPAGQPAGIPHWRHDALWDDGVRAARECLQHLTPA